MKPAFRTAPPWDDMDDMIRAYQCRFSETREKFDLFYYLSAAQYERKLGAYRTLLQRLGDEVGSLLDAGCGTGELLNYYIPKQGYLGVDLVPEFVATAQNTFPTFKFVCADLFEGVVPEHDTVVLVGALGASPRPMDLLQRTSLLARRYFLFDYLPSDGSAAQSWLRTVSTPTVSNTLAQNGWTVFQKLNLGTSTSLMACRRMG